MSAPDVLAHRLNFDVIVFSGCTLKEMQVIGALSLFVCMVLLGGLMKGLIDLGLVGVGLAFPTSVGVTWGLAQGLARLKQGKPKGYGKQRLLLFCEDVGLLPALYVRRSGYWSVGRSYTQEKPVFSFFHLILRRNFNVSQSEKLDVRKSTPSLSFNRNVEISGNLSEKTLKTGFPWV